jgi:predicted MFS family arabinose efflux permease
MLKPDRRVVITALGITQILAWGSSYYLPAVLAKPIAADTGWPLSLVVGGLSLGLLAAGLVAPRVGRTIDRLGGRPVLAFSSVLIASGQVTLALAHTLPIYFLAWLVMGVGMGAGLYDAAFSTLGRLYGEGARRAITSLTLWGGFASTVCWPLSAYLVETLGWRGACLVYASLQVCVSLPIHLLLMPRVPPAARSPEASQRERTPVDPQRRRALLLLGSILVLGAMISSVVSVHLLTVLQARGLDLATAVALGAMVGPSQVASRVIEMTVGVRFHPIWTMLTALGLIAAGLLLLWTGIPVPGAALVLYGLGNGIYSIARGTLPLALFGRDGYATLMGRLAMPALLASALSPSLGAFLLDVGGPGLMIATLVAAAATSVTLVVVLRWASGRMPAYP